LKKEYAGTKEIVPTYSETNTSMQWSVKELKQ
jgi:hypothetical protein